MSAREALRVFCAWGIDGSVLLRVIEYIVLASSSLPFPPSVCDSTKRDGRAESYRQVPATLGTCACGLVIVILCVSTCVCVRVFVCVYVCVRVRLCE